MDWLEHVDVEFSRDIYTEVMQFKIHLLKLLQAFANKGSLLYELKTDGEVCQDIADEIKNEEKYLDDNSINNLQALWNELDEAIERISINRKDGMILVYLNLYPQEKNVLAEITSTVMRFILDKYPDTLTLDVQTRFDMDLEEGTAIKKYITLGFVKPSSEGN